MNPLVMEDYDKFDNFEIKILVFYDKILSSIKINLIFCEEQER